MIINPSRRGLITGLASLIAAPAIVKADSLMKIVAPKPLDIVPRMYQRGHLEHGTMLDEYAFVYKIKWIRLNPDKTSTEVEDAISFKKDGSIHIKAGARLKVAPCPIELAA